MPPRSRKPAGPTPIDSVQHKDKRTNLPTADAQQLVTPEVEQARQIIAGFEEATAAGKGVVTVNGRMIENLHVANAQRVLAVAAAIAALG